jgi:hypothetical protein
MSYVFGHFQFGRSESSAISYPEGSSEQIDDIIPTIQKTNNGMTADAQRLVMINLSNQQAWS